MPTRPQTQPSTITTRPQTQTTSVRRNLFNAHLSRRPTAPHSQSTYSQNLPTYQPSNSQSSHAPSRSNSSNETLRLDSFNPDSSQHSGIVSRNAAGDFEFGEVSLPDDHEDCEDLGRRAELDRNKELSEAVRIFGKSADVMDRETEELLEEVKYSLRMKTAALADDSWMYETEEQPASR